MEKHVERVMNKIGVNSRVEVAAWHAGQTEDNARSRIT